MELNEALEMYLEEMLLLSKTKPVLRQIEISQKMGCSRPTISNMMKKLAQMGLVELHEDAKVSLTEKGLAIAEDVYEKHRVLTCMLTSLGVDKERAQKEACRIEHVISDETLEQIKRHYRICVDND
ncbi:MAG TPA: metal-dependent transcriptional regulator [Bellilinea sp.]|nr:metal-dependent transcriptional regulator [Bellilinea sp.]